MINSCVKKLLLWSVCFFLTLAPSHAHVGRTSLYAIDKQSILYAIDKQSIPYAVAERVDPYALVKQIVPYTPAGGSTPSSVLTGKIVPYGLRSDPYTPLGQSNSYTYIRQSVTVPHSLFGRSAPSYPPVRQSGPSYAFVGRSLLLLLGLAFSSPAGALPCDDDPEEGYRIMKSYMDSVGWENAHIDSYFKFGVSILCLNDNQRSKVQQSFDSGMGHIQYAADRNDIMGLFFMGVYEQTDGNFDDSTSSDLQKLSNAIHYLKKARDLIEANPHYPEGTTTTTIVFEETKTKVPISLVIFAKINYLYQEVYSKEVWADRERRSPAHKDIKGLLTDLENSTKKCLAFRRPKVVSSWVQKEKAIRFRDVNCGAYGDLARKFRSLEGERLAVASNCQPVDKLKNCEEYTVVEDKINDVFIETDNRIKPLMLLF